MSSRVLVVDDVEEWREQFRDILETIGYQVDTIKGFDEAKTFLKQTDYDLVVLDICLDLSKSYLPFQMFCHFLRRQYPNLPILATSGQKVDTTFMFNLRKQGVSDFVSKRDLSLDDLSNRIRELTGGKDEVATAQIFVSYARKDEAKVENLYEKLSSAGLKPWMDTKNILPGEEWESAIQRAIRASDFFVACLSTNSVDKRGYIQKEVKYALDIWEEMLPHDIYLIPARLEECKAPERLCRFQWVDLFQEDGWKRLVRAIQVGMERRTKGSTRKGSKKSSV